MGLNFESLTNSHIIADDILIVGSDLGPLDEHDHDRYLLQVLNQCRECWPETQCSQVYFQSQEGSLLQTFITY